MNELRSIRMRRTGSAAGNERHSLYRVCEFLAYPQSPQRPPSETGLIVGTQFGEAVYLRTSCHRISNWSICLALSSGCAQVCLKGGCSGGTYQ